MDAKAPSKGSNAKDSRMRYGIVNRVGEVRVDSFYMKIDVDWGQRVPSECSYKIHVRCAIAREPVVRAGPIMSSNV